MAELLGILRVYLLLLLSNYCVLRTNGVPEVVKIAAIFDENAAQQTYDAFQYAIQGANTGRRHLSLPGTSLVPRIVQDFKADLFTGPHQFCALAEEGIAAVFGPQRRLSTGLIASVANATFIPHLMTRWRLAQNHPNTGINLHPNHVDVSKALTDLIKYFNWTAFVLIYDDTESLIRASDLLDGMNDLRPDAFKLNVTDIASTLRDVMASGRSGTETSRIVLDCPTRIAQDILRVANSMNMTVYYHYILTTWDIHLLDFENIVVDYGNINALQLIDVTDPLLLKASKGWGAAMPNNTSSRLGVTTEAALIYDSFQLFVKGLKKAEETMEITPESLNCDREQKWRQGMFLRKVLTETRFKGLTGNVSFDALGHRTNLRLHVMEPLLNIGLQRVGYWTNDEGIKIGFNYTGYRSAVDNSVKGKMLRVLVVLEAPYVMLKANCTNCTGNERFRGFCVDMLQDLSQSLNFSYEIINKTGSYGYQDPTTKEWHGLIRDLIDKKGDMIVGALTITRDREEVVDFSQPFHYLGVRILLQKPERKPPNLFSFLDPLHVSVWIFILCGYISMTCVLFIIGRFSPYEWYNPNPCVEEAGVVENQFSVFNAMWFAFGSLMQIGTEIAPRAISTRFLAGIWWFFTMIMVGSYTANLAAYLTVGRMILPIEDAHGLSKQTEIKYGCLEGGATCKFFEKSVYPDYMRMWGAIQANKSNFVKSNEEGIARVRDPKGLKGYAYLMESSTMDYTTSRDCNLVGVGKPLDTKGYGIAFPKNSPYRKDISVQLLTQQDKGHLEEFRIKWWKTEDGGKTCEDENAASGTNAMGLDMVGGVFVVVLLGIALGFITAIIEFVWKFRKNPEDYKESLVKEMWKALRGAFRHPFAKAKPIVRLATLRQLCDETASTAVPLSGNPRRYF